MLYMAADKNGRGNASLILQRNQTHYVAGMVDKDE